MSQSNPFTAILWEKLTGLSLNNYRIRVNKPPLLIKPPHIQNSNKPPPFCPKSPLFGAFLGKFWKYFKYTLILNLGL